MNCLFCGNELEKGKIYHNTESCISKRRKINNYLKNGDRITVGVATCGLSAGAGRTLKQLQEANLGMPVEEVGCSGMCYNEPIVTIRQSGRFSIYAEVSGNRPEELAQAIRDENKHNDCFVGESLKDIDFFKKQTRMIMKRCGHISPLNFKQYLATEGYLGLENAVSIGSLKVRQEVNDSGLRGRGGAGFSTGTKWEFLAKNKGEKYLIVNADEGDPGAFMNRTVMESDPFQVLEGLTIAAYATGAKKGFVYCRAEYPLAVQTLKKAIKILKENGFLGESILGVKGFDFEVELREGAGAYVCGEETALIKSMEGRRGHPMPRPPYPAQQGLFGKPTNINNVETYSHTTHILKMGSQNYKKVGCEGNTGTKCVCITGKINCSERTKSGVF